MTDGYYYCLNCHSEITPDYNEHCSFCGTTAIAVPGDYTNEEVERAFDLLNKEQEGRINVPPCKVGDTVYQIDDERVYELKVKNVIYDTPCIAFDSRAVGNGLIFLTKEEAEKALKERNKE